MVNTGILNYVIIVLLVLVLAFVIYTILRKPKCNCTGALDQMLAGSYTNCNQYKTSSGCKKSKLNCQWVGTSCSYAGSGPTPPPPGPRPSGEGVSAWMGGNDWILQIKLGAGLSNCTTANKNYLFVPLSVRKLYSARSSTHHEHQRR